MGCGCDKKTYPDQHRENETSLSGDIKWDGGNLECGDECSQDCESFFQILDCTNLNDAFKKLFDLVCNRAPKNYYIVQDSNHLLTNAGLQVINTGFNLVLDPGCYVVDFSTSAHPGWTGTFPEPIILTSKWFDFWIVSNQDVTKTDIDGNDQILDGSVRRFRNASEAVSDPTIMSIPIYTKGQTLVVPEGEQRIVKVVFENAEEGWGLYNDRILSALKIA